MRLIVNGASWWIWRPDVWMTTVWRSFESTCCSFYALPLSWKLVVLSPHANVQIICFVLPWPLLRSFPKSQCTVLGIDREETKSGNGSDDGIRSGSGIAVCLRLNMCC